MPQFVRMMNLKIFIISLQKSKRRTFQLNQFKKLKLKFDFIDAVGINNISQKSYDILHRQWDRPLHLSEVACYKSHHLAWTKVQKLNKPALILEDDAYVSRDLPTILKRLVLFKNIDYINLENRCRKKYLSRTYSKINDVYRLYSLYQDRTGAAGYILWPNGASKLLECEKKKGIALADAQISNCRSLISHQVEPTPIIQLDVAKYYEVEKTEFSDLSISSVYSKIRLRKSKTQVIKRVFSQLTLGLRHFLLLIISEKRFLEISRKETFR